MTITVNISLTDSRAVLDALAFISEQLNSITQKENILAQELEALTAQVAANTTVIGSAKDLIVGLKTKLDEAIAANAAGDPTKLTALAATLKDSDDALAAAVAANTPAAPPAPGGTPAP